jgi:hypothetical protein
VASVTDDEHTDSSLDEMTELGYRFSESIKAGPLKDLHNNWCFPKFHLFVCHMRRTRQELGHPLNCSADPFERKHKPVKQDYSAGSQNNPRDQMVKRIELRCVSCYVCTNMRPCSLPVRV